MANKIINFHDVYDKKWFEQTLLILKNKYNLIDVDDVDSYYYDNKKLQNSCLITVDDGDRTFYDNIFPILVKHKTPAILFVSPKIISDDQNFWFQEIRGFDKENLKQIISKYFKTDLIYQNPIDVILKNCKIDDIWEIIYEYKHQNNIRSIKTYNMNLEQLREVNKCKFVTIGAHSQNHPILMNEDNITSKKEIIESIEQLESLLSYEIKYFAYPNGTPDLDFGQREISYLKQEGIRLAFSTKAYNFSYSDNPLALPRFGLSYGSKNFIKTKLYLGQYWEAIKSLKRSNEEDLRKELKSKVELAK